MPRIEFWYELASNYSYLCAMRIEAMADAAGIEVDWRPFLLGPLFRAQGWASSPFNLYPAKGRYMIRDMQRLTAARGLAFHLPSPFPANSLKAARIATAGIGEGWVAAFSKAVYLAQFAQRRDIADAAVLGHILDGLGLEQARILALSETEPTRAALRRATEQAACLGIFGAPRMRTADGELFWGDDRLADALAWATK